MEITPDWRLWVFIALGIAVMFVLPPPMETLFYGSKLLGIIVVCVRAALGVALGACAYLLVFGRSNSS
jgi:hypothetical protein